MPKPDAIVISLAILVLLMVALGMPGVVAYFLAATVYAIASEAARPGYFDGIDQSDRAAIAMTWPHEVACYLMDPRQP